MVAAADAPHGVLVNVATPAAAAAAVLLLTACLLLHQHV
jgi:hypothetical protein